MGKLKLEAIDQALLTGELGPAAAQAMALMHRYASLAGAAAFMSVDRAHVASAYDNTPVNGDFAAHMRALDARVRVPTTLTACGTDQATLLADPEGKQATLIAAHVAMGCEPLLSCAPYQQAPPQPGEVLAWCESSAVVYANSVSGARCLRCPEFLDLCAALTGRIPELGPLQARARFASCLVDLGALGARRLRQRYWLELLGLWLGLHVGRRVPCLSGLPATTSRDDLRALGAAAAASGSLDLFHAPGLTPEAPDQATAFGGRPPRTILRPDTAELLSIAEGLDRSPAGAVSAVCIGAPHASAAELRSVAGMLAGRAVASGVSLLLTANQGVWRTLEQDGTAQALKDAGAICVDGRCSYYRPALPGVNGRVVTPSAKWAWYARRQLDCAIAYRATALAVEAAVTGTVA